MKNQSSNKLTRFLLVWLLLCLCSCAVHKKRPESEVIVSLRKTACMGNCPVYTLKIFRDRYAILEGEQNIPFIGTFFTRLTEKEITELEKKFSDIGFFDLKNEYAEKMTDLPTTYIYYYKGGKSKRIKDYYGAPPELKELEVAVENLLGKKRWKKIRNGDP